MTIEIPLADFLVAGKLADVPGLDPDKLHVFLINVSDRFDRFARFMDSAAQQDVEVVRLVAINTSDVTSGMFDHLIDRPAFESYSGRDAQNGEYGCFLSHVAAWHLIAKLDLPGVVVFEDDYVFRDDTDFGRLVQDAVARLDSQQPLVIKLSGKLPKRLKKKPQADVRGLYPLVSKFGSAGAYYMNRRGARAMLETRPVATMPLDHYLFRPWLKSIGFFVFVPFPAKPPGDESSIGNRAAKWPWWKRRGRLNAQIKRYTRQVAFSLSHPRNLFLRKL